MHYINDSWMFTYFTTSPLLNEMDMHI